ncbi:probable leucine-rich repeat receptor-like protein kinase At2g33170 isoform X2 [Durio zibethinus]|uniref:Probable leucine-rich repeat receptor-like protein kinase At2g33170 isoform X2 n=1 Tax=Durio zibethinus TaxID=66656 RepID=A0A6P5X2H3_DURZI|nr:probable leucine-rich repeat receptor-like protein kinase At2g33170 isoform X2 [Durio zibethinus]
MKNLHILISLIFPTLFLFSCSISLVLSFSPPDLQNQCLHHQKSALLQLHHDLYYAPNFTFSSKVELWDPNTDCCSWKGITCDALGHVIELDLSYKNLSGSFHSILNLHHLQRLNLAGNNFNTTLFQYEFDKFPNLTHLNLSNSCFHGQIPVEISYLTRLVFLDLSHQDSCYLHNYQILDWYVDFPDYLQQPLKLKNPNFKSLIQNLRPLTELYLDGVNISTQSSKWCEITSTILPNLHVLSLSNCGLTGPFCSSLSRLPFLSKLVLDWNTISYLPPNLLEISSRLVSLSLVNCNLSGHFPTEILKLPKIESIDISNNYALGGQLPEFPSNNALRILTISFTNFSGKLPESIGNLKFLTNLNLWYSNFFGQIPSSIANLTNLVELNLGYNNFSGLIPPFHRSGVPNLGYLYLWGNHLSGSIHSSLFTLPSLHTLLLEENQLVGEIREIPNASSSLIEVLYLGFNSFSSVKLDVFFQLKNLRRLHLSNINLSIEGNITSLAFPQLEMLYLHSCNLTEFPEFIKTQDKLAFLYLPDNQIHGFVPNWLCKTTLLSLDLSFNTIDFPTDVPFGDANSSFPMLSYLRLRFCNLSMFPEFLKSQTSLKDLDLSNNKISGAVPNWVWKKSLRYLDLSNNSLSSLDQFSLNQSLTSSQGSLSRPICNLSQLVTFNASFNKLSGPIPSCLGNISSLSSLDLQKNNFSGSIPDFAKATHLYWLQLNDNKLEGKLPRSLANCTILRVLNLGNNALYDTFPLWLGKLPTLMVLVLQANRFYGPIKHVKNYFQDLDVLDIAFNNFSGQLPIEFFQAPQLRSLKIDGNKLEGKLPRSLAHCTKLEVLDVGKNMIQDTFPFWLEKLLSLKAMRMMIVGDQAKPDYIGDNYYQDSVTIVNKGFELFYKKILTIFACLDLSNNSFHGRIPEEIQKLKSLKVLNLSYNSFLGPIPLALGNLTELESLDLSQNKLSGKIPLQLTSLTFLAVLNLSYNQLEGSIPQSYQFGTFSNDSYEGNPRLCGLPLTRKCNEDGPGMPPPKEDGDSWVDGLSDWKIVLMGYGCGLVIGLCIGYTVLNELGNKWLDRFTQSRNKKWRRSSR